MSKEFDQVQQLISAKQADLATQAQQKREMEEENRRREEKRKIDFEKTANENRRIFENGGVVRLFQEIIDSGIVKLDSQPPTPINRQKISRKISYTPAIINWSEEHSFETGSSSHPRLGDETDNTAVSLLFNKKYVFDDTDAHFTYDSLSY